MSLENKLVNKYGKVFRLTLQTVIGAKFGYESLQSTIAFQNLAHDYGQSLKENFGSIIYWSFQISVPLSIATIGTAITYAAVKYSGVEMKNLFENF